MRALTCLLLLLAVTAPASLRAQETNGNGSRNGSAALLARAESLAAEGRHREAAEAFSEALRDSPGSESIRYRMAAQLAYAKEYEAAETEYRKLTGSSNPSMAALARNSLSGMAEEKQQTERFTLAQTDQRLHEAEARKQQAQRERAYRAREAAMKSREADFQKRQEIYDLLEAGETREALEKIDQYTRTNSLPLDLQYSRIYALQRLQEYSAADEALAAMPDEAKANPEYWLIRGRNQLTRRQPAQARESFITAASLAKGTDLERQIRVELRSLPPELRPDAWTWGELRLDAFYTARFSDAIFYGELRQGIFIPGARWIQPFLQLDFTLDTRTGQIAGVPQVFANNLAGGHAGVRIRLIPGESLWLYGLAGIQKDLKDTTRYNGQWFFDWRTGIRGYKGFGPGLLFLDPSWYFKTPEGRWDTTSRLAWFAEGGADAAWYSLYENLIAYGQLREGFRVLETGGWMGWDVYALQQGSADSEGLYYNNFVEAGLGLRLITKLLPMTSLITRVEYVGGAYFGVDNQNSRGSLPSAYDDFRITLSLWAEW